MSEIKTVKRNSMKKVLIFSLAYLPFIGGAELAVKEITDRIYNFEFDMITLRFNKQWPRFEKIGNINVYRVDGSKLFFGSILSWVFIAILHIILLLFVLVI